MKKVKKVVLSLALALTLLFSCATVGFAAKKSDKTTMYVGVGSADITGPITSISNGYNSVGNLIEGLLMRLHSRAFIVQTGNTPVVYVSVELVHMTESIKPMVLKELKSRGLSQYGEENVMISATHCHSSGSNNSWYGLYDLINGVPGYDDDATDLIVSGIADSIEAAHEDLAPGSVTLSYADTDIESYNRSLAAAKWNNNYDDSQYSSDFEAACKTVSKEMSILSFSHTGEGEIGMLSFFPSHGTSNPIDNVYLAADHKGYAAYYVEQEKGNGYVAAFAQNECGDVSPNQPQEDDVTAAFQRPADVDDSLDVIENQIAAGQQEADAALKILEGGKGVTTIKLSGEVRYNYEIVDYSNISVDEKYIGSYKMDYDDVSTAKTSDPCIGAGIIAGDEEGAPVDNAEEGAVRNNYYLDEDGNVVREKYDFSSIDLYGLEKIAPQVWPIAMKILLSDKYDDEQMEKLVCLDTASFGLKTVNEPLQIFTIGEVAICGNPFELTTEAGRRTKEALTDTLSQIGVKHIILSGYSNSYSQYLTTREEYAAQHYEGATCLYGPWSQAALAQELDKLSQDLVAGKHTKYSLKMKDTQPALIQTPAAVVPSLVDTGDYGTLKTDVKESYKNGETVTAVWQGVNPRHVTEVSLSGKVQDDYTFKIDTSVFQFKLGGSQTVDNAEELLKDYTYMAVEQLVDGKWVQVRDDGDPYTYFHSTATTLTSTSEASANWLLRNVDKGTYRLVYNGIAKTGTNSFERFTAYSSSFKVV